MIQVQGTGFNPDGTMNLGVRFSIGRIEGNFNAVISEKEFIDAMNNNELIELGERLLLELNQEVAEEHQIKLSELQEENKELKAQIQMSNISMTMMIAELEEKINNKDLPVAVEENENNMDN